MLRLKEELSTSGSSVVVDIDDTLLPSPSLPPLLSTSPYSIQLLLPATPTPNAYTKLTTLDLALGGGESEENVILDMRNLLKVMSTPLKDKKDIELDMGSNTFFLSLTYKDVRESLPLLKDLCDEVDALELRVDLLEDKTVWGVLRQLSILRRNMPSPPLPIIWTVRSQEQCGAFVNDKQKIFDFLYVGLRGGVEVGTR